MHVCSTGVSVVMIVIVYVVSRKAPSKLMLGQPGPTSVLESRQLLLRLCVPSRRRGNIGLAAHAPPSTTVVQSHNCSDWVMHFVDTTGGPPVPHLVPAKAVVSGKW